MTLRDLLRDLGLRSGAQVQPDVSGFTLANLVVQTGGQPEPMIAALGALYEQVITLERAASHIVLDLWRTDQPMAAMICTYGPQTNCTFTYWDPEPRVNAFLQQASTWADAELGPLTQSTGPDGTAQWSATDGAVRLTLSRPATGDAAEARAMFHLPK